MITDFINNATQAINFMQLQHDLLIACDYQQLPEHLKNEIKKAIKEYSALFIQQIKKKSLKRKKPLNWQIRL